MIKSHPTAKQKVWPQRTIFTVGHSNLAIDDFIGLLRTYGIKRLVDIRTIPGSRHNPQFNSDALRESLKQAKIDYIALPTLGGLRHSRKDSPNTGWHNKSFRGYADYMQTKDFEDGLRRLQQLGRSKRTAIMCAEAVPWRCHRSLVADALVVRDILVVEILSVHSAREHKLTPFAHVQGTTVTYPSSQPDLL
jgi:uncharacterized protein (DUF488 family)